MNQDESVKTETKEKVEYREVTAAAVILGIVQGVLMTAAFVYAGLKLGFTLSGSAVAAILGFAVLKGVMRKGTIIENNINQTIASGINIAGSGVIFTLPVLLLMKEEFSIIPMILAGIAGSIMGVTVIIPLRKQMIDLERLRFPSGTAVAAILKSPGAGVEKALLLGSGFLLALITVVLIKKNILPAEIPLGKMWGFPEYTQTAIALSLMNLGAGMLAGKGGLPFAFGGALAFWFMAPVAVTNQWTTGDMVYGDMLRPIGIGMLIGGALMGVVKAFPAVKAAFKTLKSAAATGFKGGDELPIRYIYGGVALAFVTLFAASIFGAKNINIPTAFIISVVGTIWLALAGLIVAECTGMTDISPLSGLALIAVTMMLALTGNNVVAAVLIGMAVCVATAQCADMMTDLKTGFLVGGRPVKQQTVQLAIAWLGPIISIFVVLLLWGAEGGGFGPGTPLPAPQAGALQAMIEGVQGGNAPIHRYATGGILGALLSMLPVGGLGVLVGLAMYLPFSITLGYGVGCILNIIIEKVKSSQFIEDKIVPLAAGLIVGEALTELGYSAFEIFKSLH